MSESNQSAKILQFRPRQTWEELCEEWATQYFAAQRPGGEPPPVRGSSFAAVLAEVRSRDMAPQMRAEIAAFRARA